MKRDKVFFQDFLFKELPVDKQDFPITEIIDLPDSIKKSDCVVLSFERLLRMNHLYEWNRLFSSAKNKIVCINDDVILKNEELLIYKDFYLKMYIYNIMQNCKECYVCR